MSLSSRDNALGDGALAVRPARRGDLGAILAIENTAFASDRLSRRSLLRLLGVPTAVFLVAELRGKLVGSCILLLRSQSRRVRLYSLAVDSAHGGKGIGTALLDAAESRALQHGCVVMTLEVRRDNESARRLYQRRGFSLVGESRDYYADGESALHFVKQLGTAQADLHGAAA